MADPGRNSAHQQRPGESLRRLRCAISVVALLAVAAAVSAQEPPELRVGAIRYKTESAFRATYEPLVAFLAGELGMRPELTLVDESDLAYKLAAGDFDLGVFTPFPYLKAKLEFPELEVFASHQVRGVETYRGAIVVRAESAIESLADLRDRSVLFVKPTSTSGFKLPRGILGEHGIAPDEGSEGVSFSGGHDVSLRALLAGETDAVAIDFEALGELDPGEGAELRVLEEYHVPYHAYVLSPRLPAATRQRVIDTMLDAYRNPASRAAFDNPLGIERWVARDDTFYNALRRYLGMVRAKPQVTVELRLKESARRALDDEGDLLEALEDAMGNQLSRSGRFAVPRAGSGGAARQVMVDLALVGSIFHCQLYLDDTWLHSVDLERSQLLARLPAELTHQVLAATPLEAPLLYNGSAWFITYGTNDGILPDDYEFALREADGSPVPLAPAEVTASTPLNTFFLASEALRRGAVMTLRYRPPNMASTELASLPDGEADEISHDHPEPGRLRSFWNNLDNRWGVIGLVAALLSLAVGGYLRLRKQRRFRTVLNESLDLLRLYIEGKYDLEARLLEQREKILHLLERNFINENQYLILKNHLDEVETVIAQLAAQGVADTQEVQAELQKIVRDGKITADELEHLAGTLREVEDALPSGEAGAEAPHDDEAEPESKRP